MCLSHFRKTAAKSLPSSFPPGQSAFLHARAHTHTQLQEEKNPNYCQTPRSVTREGGKGKRLGRTSLLLACPNHDFSVLEGHYIYLSSGLIYRQESSKEKCTELVTELRERLGPLIRGLKAATLIWMAQNIQSARFLMHLLCPLPFPVLCIPQVTALGATVAFSRTAGHWEASSHYTLVRCELISNLSTTQAWAPTRKPHHFRPYAHGLQVCS